MAATIKIKNSSTAGAAPTSSDLVQGELAVNVTDKRLYTENASGTVVELGTNPSVPVTFPDGSASAPSLTNDGDTNTGLFFPAADTVGIATGGSERARVDSSGNLGLGVTPSAWTTYTNVLQTGGVSLATNGVTFGLGANWYYDGQNRYKGTGNATLYGQSSGAHTWFTSSSGTAGNAITFTQAMTLDASGNLGVGVTSPGSYSSLGYRLVVGDGAGNEGITIATGTGDNGSLLFADGTSGSAAYSGYVQYDHSIDAMKFGTGGSERARITSSGGLWVGTSTRQSTSNHAFIQNTVNDWTANFQCNTGTSSQNLGVLIYYAGSSPNNTSAQFLLCQDPGGTRAEFRSNGGLANYSANNANLSDVRTKTDIQDAGSYLSKICAIPVRTFKYKDQTDDLLNLGVIAQEVETVAPELVDVSGFGETPEDGVPLKAIYQTDLQYALMKALQELKAEFDAYKAAHP